MRSVSLALCLCFTSICTFAQSDIFETSKGEIKMTPILHATLVLEWNDKTVYFDPYGGAERFEEFNAPDLVFITHAHGDHLDKETLAGLDLSSAQLVAPPSVIDELGDIEFDKITSVLIHDEVEVHGIEVEVIPMYNLPDDETSRHKRGWGNAYLLTIDGQRIYISGDTEDIPEMRALEDIDYAFVCMNLPYTMDVASAADAVLEFRPKVIYPFHYRGKNGFSDIEKFKELVGTDPDIEVRLRDWYPE